MKKNTWILLGVVVLIIVVILGINYLKPNGGGDLDEEVISCVASKAKLYTTPTCGVCAAQKEYLGKHLDKFEIIDCAVDRDECVDVGINRVPTWVIGEEQYVRKMTFSELKDLSGC